MQSHCCISIEPITETILFGFNYKTYSVNYIAPHVNPDFFGGSFLHSCL